MKTLVLVAAVVILGFAIGTMIAAHRQTSASLALEQTLVESVQPNRLGAGALDELPPPVARYLQWALQGRREIAWVRMKQAGSLRTDARSGRWMTFSATHLVVPRSTGFVWRARVTVAPLIHVRVRDALVGGVGSGQVSLLSALTVAKDEGTPQMNAGSLHRYLAEAVWYPTAFFPSDRLQWRAIDDSRALATLTTHQTSVSLEFRFASSGAITGIYTPARWGSFDGGYRELPWGRPLSSVRAARRHRGADDRRRRLVYRRCIPIRVEGTDHERRIERNTVADVRLTSVWR